MLCDSYISDLQKMHTYNLCDSCMGVMQKMHSRLFLSGMTDSVMRLSDSLSSVNRIHESSKKYLRIVVIQQHYTKYPVNLYFCIIDLSFGIANLSFRIDSGKFGYTTGILGSTPSSGNKEYPLQWKLRVDPHSGNMVLIR
jgi:hypothetical protein